MKNIISGWKKDYVNAQFKTATERYENLLQQTPHILERVPLGLPLTWASARKH